MKKITAFDRIKILSGGGGGGPVYYQFAKIRKELEKLGLKTSKPEFDTILVGDKGYYIRGRYFTYTICKNYGKWNWDKVKETKNLPSSYDLHSKDAEKNVVEWFKKNLSKVK